MNNKRTLINKGRISPASSANEAPPPEHPAPEQSPAPVKPKNQNGTALAVALGLMLPVGSYFAYKYWPSSSLRGDEVAGQALPAASSASTLEAAASSISNPSELLDRLSTAAVSLTQAVDAHKIDVSYAELAQASASSPDIQAEMQALSRKSKAQEDVARANFSELLMQTQRQFLGNPEMIDTLMQAQIQQAESDNRRLHAARLKASLAVVKSAPADAGMKFFVDFSNGTF
jgi:hypothetical protein